MKLISCFWSADCINFNDDALAVLTKKKTEFYLNKSILVS